MLIIPVIGQPELQIGDGNKAFARNIISTNANTIIAELFCTRVLQYN